MPTTAELTAYYRSTYRLDYQFAFGSGPPRFHVRRSLREAESRAQLLAPILVEGARVLDFGAGSGEFLMVAEKAGANAIGVEPGADYAAFARESYGVRVIEDLDAPLPLDQFDLITVRHVLEHLRDPVAVTKRLAGLLAPGGLLYVSVPSMEPDRKPPHERFHFGHVHGYVPETLDMIAASAGLVPDPRFVRDGTTVVYKHAEGPLELSLPNRALAERVRGFYPQRSVMAYVATLRWIGPTLRRGLKVVRDSYNL